MEQSSTFVPAFAICCLVLRDERRISDLWNKIKDRNTEKLMNCKEQQYFVFWCFWWRSAYKKLYLLKCVLCVEFQMRFNIIDNSWK